MSDAENPQPNSPKLPIPDEPKLPGPEIPNAEVSESGVFTVRTGDTEVYEAAEVQFGLGLGLDAARPIEWLWPERIPLGTVTLLEGGTETGKSLIVADLAARVSRSAPWPGGGGSRGEAPRMEDRGGRIEGREVPGPNPSGPIVPGPNVPEPNLSGKVLYVCGDLEDWDRTVLPRLMQAGAEMLRVGHLSHITTRHPCVESRAKARSERRLSFPEDLGHLEFQLRVHADMRLVIVDALTLLCPSARARQETLRQLNEIAARRNVAIVVATCPARQAARNKLVPTVDRRSDAVRCVFNTLRDLEDERLFYLAPARMTFAAKPQWLPYRIGPTGIVWEAPRDAPPEASGISEAMRDKRALRDEAIEWLRQELKEGPVSQKQLVREAKEYGFSLATLRRAKEELKLQSQRTGFGPGISHWAWALPGNAQAAAQTPAPVADVSTYGKTAEKTAGQGTPRDSNGIKGPSPAEFDEYLEGLGPDLDDETLARRMTPAIAARVIGKNRDTGEGQPERRSRRRRRSRKNGKPGANGRHESNGKR